MGIFCKVTDMNQREWKYSARYDGKYKWRNKAKSIQKSLKYNSNPNATLIHHLRDTEEQRKYNDEHYELWGHNLDGTFEYGKYVIFVTKEEHTEIHKCSEETRKKRSESLKNNHPMRGKHLSSATKEKLRIANTGKHHTDETIEKIKRNHSHNRLGKHHTDETKQLLREINTGKHHTDESKSKISKSLIGIKREATTKDKIGAASRDRWSNQEFIEKYKQQCSVVSNAYKEYKASGGSMSWNEFQKAYKERGFV